MFFTQHFEIKSLYFKCIQVTSTCCSSKNILLLGETNFLIFVLSFPHNKNHRDMCFTCEVDKCGRNMVSEKCQKDLSLFFSNMVWF